MVGGLASSDFFLQGRGLIDAETVEQILSQEHTLRQVRHAHRRQAPTALSVSHTDLIAQGVALIRKQLHPEIVLSADVFGRVALAPDEVIGKDAVKMGAHLDIICPMLYPSLWNQDAFGISKPSSEPFEVIKQSSQGLAKQLRDAHLDNLVVRPWLEIGYWGDVTYSEKELYQQLRGSCQSDVHGWMLW